MPKHAHKRRASRINKAQCLRHIGDLMQELMKSKTDYIKVDRHIDAIRSLITSRVWQLHAREMVKERESIFDRT
jgi:hypothetical protein